VIRRNSPRAERALLCGSRRLAAASAAQTASRNIPSYGDPTAHPPPCQPHNPIIRPSQFSPGAFVVRGYAARTGPNGIGSAIFTRPGAMTGARKLKSPRQRQWKVGWKLRPRPRRVLVRNLGFTETASRRVSSRIQRTSRFMDARVRGLILPQFHDHRSVSFLSSSSSHARHFFEEARYAGE